MRDNNTEKLVTTILGCIEESIFKSLKAKIVLKLQRM